MKLIKKADNPAIAPIKKNRPPRKDEFEIMGNKVKDQNITKTIFAAMIETTAEIEIRNIIFEFIPVLVLVSIMNTTDCYSHNATAEARPI